MRRILLARLAVADLLHDRKVSLFMMATLVAVIAPLLLLFGLKQGVVEQLRSDLVRSPDALEVRMLGSGDFDDAWVAAAQARADVAFAVGMTRALNLRGDLLADSRRFAENIELIPTADGDPLRAEAQAASLPSADVAAQTLPALFLSSALAMRLQAAPGDTLTLGAQRRLDGVLERGQWQVWVADVLPAHGMDRLAALAPLPLLVELERFRDGYRVERSGLTTGRIADDGEPVRYARVRLYAPDADRISSLARWLQEQHIDTRSQQAQADSVRQISTVLGWVFGVIAVAALLGCIASLAGAFLSNIERKRRNLALLGLLGSTQGELAWLMQVQALCLSSAAYACSLLIYGLGSLVFDTVLGGGPATGRFVCELAGWQMAMGYVLTLLLAGSVSWAGTRRAVRIDPAESLREVG
ncbi:ABC transporter permease [Corticimicrobacter populi]|uniref:ABC transporter permease n=2 Tax=Corticimicrobacter populi TaxID=2175229 RepID=A0A2V1JTV1_9BURK|nr:ABC transporter permease [Corticimicrobacter populi]